MKRIAIVAVMMGIVLIGYLNRGFIRDVFFQMSKPTLPAASSYSDLATATSTATSTSQLGKDPVQVSKPTSPQPGTPVVKKPSSEASELNLAVPFQSQAPFGDWSEPYENGCEEASIIMVDYYLRGASLSKQQMKDAIDEQVAWQFKNFGGHYDLEVSRVKEVAEEFYGYTVQIIQGLTPAKIKEQLALGRPVVVPSAGRELGNPNFTGEGPLYHMLVIKGYTKNGEFITNDPGTRNGHDYIYDADVLMSAIRDWDAANHSPDGPKVGLVMYK